MVYHIAKVVQLKRYSYFSEDTKIQNPFLSNPRGTNKIRKSSRNYNKQKRNITSIPGRGTAAKPRFCWQVFHLAANFLSPTGYNGYGWINSVYADAKTNTIK